MIAFHPLFIDSYSPIFKSFMPTNIVSGESPISYPVLPVIVVIALIIAIVGLIRVAPWSRMVACIVIGNGALLPIGLSIMLVTTTEFNMTDMLKSLWIIDILLLFLAFKLYTSQQLKNYLDAVAYP